MENESIMSKAVDMISMGLQSKLEDIFIEGLKLKGFEFNGKFELENFVKLRVTKTVNSDKKECIYLIDGIPFLSHNYEIKYEPIIEYKGVFTMSANWGSYSFL